MAAAEAHVLSKLGWAGRGLISAASESGDPHDSSRTGGQEREVAAHGSAEGCGGGA